MALPSKDVSIKEEPIKLPLMESGSDDEQEHPMKYQNLTNSERDQLHQELTKLANTAEKETFLKKIGSKWNLIKVKLAKTIAKINSYGFGKAQKTEDGLDIFIAKVPWPEGDKVAYGFDDEHIPLVTSYLMMILEPLEMAVKRTFNGRKNTRIVQVIAKNFVSRNKSVKARYF